MNLLDVHAPLAVARESQVKTFFMPKPVCLKVTKKKAYNARLSYRKQWEVQYPWMYCTDVTHGMFC